MNKEKIQELKDHIADQLWSYDNYCKSALHPFPFMCEECGSTVALNKEDASLILELIERFENNN